MLRSRALAVFDGSLPLAAMFAGSPLRAVEPDETEKALFRRLLLQIGGASIENLLAIPGARR